VKSAVETLTPTRVRLTVEVPFEELKPSLDAAYKQIGSQVQIPGFRKGKVPMSLIDQRFGRGVVLDEAVNAYLPDAYGAAVREHEVRVLGQPDIDVTEFADGADLKFTAEVDCRPEITLPDYEGLEVEVAEAVVTEADVDEQVEALRARFATLTSVDRAAETGDFLTIDLSASRDSEVIEDATASGLSYEVGSEALLDGLDAVVVGVSAGEEATFETALNDGEDALADIVVAVKAVRERELPALDDDFAQLASEFDTLEELRADLRERLGRVKRLQQGVEARDSLLEKLLSLVDVPLPEALVDAEVESHFGDGHGDDEHREQFVEATRKNLTAQFVLDDIAEKEELQPEEGELSEYLIRQAPRYGMTADAFAQALVEAGQVPAIMGEVVRAKALAKVLETAKVVDTAGNAVDLDALADA
jgi:trigger factor